MQVPIMRSLMNKEKTFECVKHKPNFSGDLDQLHLRASSHFGRFYISITAYGTLLLLEAEMFIGLNLVYLGLYGFSAVKWNAIPQIEYIIYSH